MKAQKLDIKTPDGNCDSFVAYPDEHGKYPGVVLLMDGYGLRPYLYEMAEKLASFGYYVVVPNLFYRVKRSPVIDLEFPIKKEQAPEAMKQLAPLFQSYNYDAGVRDIGVMLDYLARQKQVMPGKMGLTGYCMGGGMAIRGAAHYPERVAAAASFHAGNLATEAPNSPHLLLSKIQAELYVAHADQDKNMPPEQMERFKQALEKAHTRYQVETYTGALHGFTMADLPPYDPSALERHWQNLKQLFERALK